MMQPDFDPNTWNCPCGGVSDIYRMNTPSGELSYYLMECMTCGVWRRFVPGLGEQEIGKELPEEVRAAMKERCEKIRAAPDPLDGALPMFPGRDEGGLPPIPGGMPPMDDPMRMEQGTIMDCGYCKHVYPDLGSDCPKCGGRGPSFRPARMMDRYTSNSELLQDLYWMFEMEMKMREKEDRAKEDVMRYRESVIGMIERIGLYRFDLREALIQRVHELDQEFDIDPKET